VYQPWGLLKIYSLLLSSSPLPLDLSLPPTLLSPSPLFLSLSMPSVTTSISIIPVSLYAPHRLPPGKLSGSGSAKWIFLLHRATLPLCCTSWTVERKLGHKSSHFLRRSTRSDKQSNIFTNLSSTFFSLPYTGPTIILNYSPC